MALRFYNQLTKQVEAFSPITAGSVGMYSCGPTVYDTPHIGNWRTLIFSDILKRTLLAHDFSVKHIMNITDIDDKIITKANQTNSTVDEIAQKYEQEFLADWEKLDLLPPTKILKATDHISEMIDLVEKLLEKGIAYQSEGSVFFSAVDFPAYGQLSGRTIDGDNTSRLEEDFGKRQPADFALWKASKADEPSYPSPFGPGRPGWHIECSAMSMCELGETFDIHTGGIDLLFPHHENELAQSQAVSGKPLAHFWLEGEMLMIEGEKMSKSFGNAFTLSDLAEKGISPDVLKMIFLSAHYRSPLNFTWQSAQAMNKNLSRLREKFASLPDGGEISADYQDQLKNILADDLATPEALALLSKLADDDQVSPADKRSTMIRFGEILGIDFNQTIRDIPAHIKQKVSNRETARSSGDWPKADQLRQEIEAEGFILKDTDSGPVIS